MAVLKVATMPLFVLLTACGCFNAISQVIHAHPVQDVPLAGEQFENISVLNEMPAEQMGKVMNIMSAALGVSCSHCHADYDFVSDELPTKQIAREMIAMTLRLNRDSFHGQQRVSCNTCHRGQTVPADKLDLAASLLDNKTLPSTDRTAANATSPADLDTKSPDEVLEEYVQAVGGKDRLAMITSRRLIGKRVEPNGRTETEELWQSATGRSRMTTLYGDLPVVEGFDDEKAWKRAGEAPIQLKLDEAEQIQTEIGIAFPLQLPKYYKSWDAVDIFQVNQRAVYSLAATRHSGLTERLNFDAESGLLVQRIVSVPTVLGSFEYRVDYDEYREIDGIYVPMEFRFMMPNLGWRRSVESVEFNAPE